MADTSNESRSVTLPVDVWSAVDTFCDARVMGRPKFFEIAALRLVSTAPPLPGTSEVNAAGQAVLDEGPGTYTKDMA